MTCPTCEQGMNCLGRLDSNVVRYWCPHCGTLVSGGCDGYGRKLVDEVEVPAWTEARKEIAS